MSRVDFYHLQIKKLEDVLPKLLEKAYGLDKKVVVRVGNSERVEFLNGVLWTYDEQSFLPHGSKKDGAAGMQPIWLTADDDVPNNAEFLFLVDGASADMQEILGFERVFNVFDGNSNEALEKARAFWKELKNEGIEVFYWQQSANGSWQQKA